MLILIMKTDSDWVRCLFGDNSRFY